jgi:hypothetical protein
MEKEEVKEDRKKIENSDFFTKALRYFGGVTARCIARDLLSKAKCKYGDYSYLEEWIPLQRPLVSDAKQFLFEFCCGNLGGGAFRGVLKSGKILDLYLYFVPAEFSKVNQLGPFFISLQDFKNIWNKLRLAKRFEREVYEEIENNYDKYKIMEDVMLMKRIPKDHEKKD